MTFYHGFNKGENAELRYRRTQYVKVSVAPAFDGNNGKFVCFVPEIRESVAQPLLKVCECFQLSLLEYVILFCFGM
jgi:hypothetical protein